MVIGFKALNAAAVGGTAAGDVCGASAPPPHHGLYCFESRGWLGVLLMKISSGSGSSVIRLCCREGIGNGLSVSAVYEKDNQKNSTRQQPAV